MKDIQQLIKKNSQQGRYEDIFPKTFIDAVLDKESGVTLTDILAMFNMLFLSYNGSRSQTRLQVPSSLRREGLWVTYVLYDKTVVTEWYSAEAIDDTTFGDSANWRDGSNALVGDISISSDGYWVINGEVTNIKAQGEAGITPILRVGSNNHLQVSYTNGSSYVDVSPNPVFTQFRMNNNKLEQSIDLGNTWTIASDYIAAWFRFTGTAGSSQADNVGKIQISRDNGATWSDLSGEFTNSLHIKGYVATVGALPSTAVQGDIYGVGPTYDTSDTEHTNPIYQLYVKDSTGWVNNGRFTSISAGVVQELGDSETATVSQNAITKSLYDSIANKLIFKSYVNNLPIKIYDIKGVFPDTDDFEIGISNIGLQDNIIYIQFTKEAQTGSENLICAVKVPVSNIKDGVNWISTNERYNSNVSYISILIDCTQLKKTPITYAGAIINKEYLVKRVPIQKNLSSGYKFSSLLDFIIDLKLYVPASLVSHNITVYNVGYNVTTKKVSVRFYDYTAAKVIGSIFIDEPEIPTGIYTINKVSIEGYIVSCTLDFSKYMEYYVIDNITDTKVIPLDLNSSEAITSISGYVNYSDIELGDVISRNSTITGEFILTRNITLTNGQCIKGKHCVVLTNDPTVSITLQDNSYIEGITFVSTKAKRVLNSTPGYYTYQNIITDDILNNIVSYIGDNQLINIRGRNSAVINCNFINIDRTAVCSLNTEDRILPANTIVSGCYFENCRCGIYNWGEFNRFIGNVFHGCELGMYMRGGNYTLGSCIFKMSDIGMYITDSGNGSHSQVTGTGYAHCGIASLYIKTLPRVLGLVFSGCHIADAPVIGINCNSLLFTGGRLDTWVDTGKGISNGFISNIIRNAYAVRDGKSLFNGNISLKNNIPMVDGIEPDINN